MAVRGTGGTAETNARVTLTGQLLGNAQEIPRFIADLTAQLKSFSAAMSQSGATTLAAGAVQNLGGLVSRMTPLGSTGELGAFLAGYSGSLPKFARSPQLLSQFQSRAHQVFNNITTGMTDSQLRHSLYNEYIGQARYLFQPNPDRPGGGAQIALGANERIGFNRGNYYVWNAATGESTAMSQYLRGMAQATGIPYSQMPRVGDLLFTTGRDYNSTALMRHQQAVSSGALGNEAISNYRGAAAATKQLVDIVTENININREKNTIEQAELADKRRRQSIARRITEKYGEEVEIRGRTVRDLLEQEKRYARMRQLDAEMERVKNEQLQAYLRLNRSLQDMGLRPLNGAMNQNVMPTSMMWQPRGVMERMLYGGSLTMPTRYAADMAAMQFPQINQTGMMGTRGQWAQRIATYNALAASNTDPNQIKKILEDAGQSAAQFNQHLYRTNDILGRTAVAMTVFYGIAQALRTVVQGARELETVYARISGITGGAFSGQGGMVSRMGMQRGINELSWQTGIRPIELAKSLEIGFQAADMPTQQALYVTKLGTQLSIGTGSPVEPIMNILMAARNAYRLENAGLEQFAKELARSRAEGVIEFPQIETGIGKVMQTSRLAGFRGLEGLNQVMALVAAVTKEAGNPSLNMTMLARTFSEISKPQTIKKLAAEGIYYDRENPLQTILDITNYGGSAETAQQFIQGSGIFGRELARRGLSLLASERSYWEPRIMGTASGGDADVLIRSFESVMDTAENRMQRVQRVAETMALTFGKDLADALDRAYKPLLALVNMLKGIPDFPGKAALGGLAAGGAEALTMTLMATAGIRTLGTLTGLTVPNRRGGGAFGNLGDSILGLGYGVFAPGMYENLVERNAQFNTAYNSFLDEGLAGGMTLGAAKRAAMGRARAGVPGMGIQIGMGNVLGALALYTVGQVAWNRWKDAQWEKLVPLQEKFETGLQNTRDVPVAFQPVGEAMRAVKEEPTQQNIRNLAVEWKSFTDEIGGTLPKYESIIELTSQWVDMNGNLTTSFESITDAMYNMTEMEIRSRMNQNILDQLKLANESVETKYKTGGLGQGLVRNTELTMTALEMIARDAGLGETATEWLVGLGTGSASAGIWLMSMFDKEEYAKLEAAADSTDPSMWRQALYDISGRPGNFDDFVSKYAEDMDKLLVDYKKLKSQLDEWTKSTDESAETSDETSKEQQQIYDKAKKLLENLKLDVAESDMNVELQGQMAGLTEEQVAEQKEESRRQLLIKKYTELIGLDLRHSSELIPEFNKLFKDEISAMEEAVQNTEKLNGALKGVTQATFLYEASMQNLSEAAKDAAAKAERQSWGIEQSQLARESYFETANQLQQILTGFIPGAAGETAALMVKGRLREQSFKLSQARMADQNNLSLLKREEIARQKSQLQADLTGQIELKRAALRQTTDPQEQAQIQQEINVLERRLAREPGQLEFQGQKLKSEQEFNVAQTMTGGALELLAQLAEVSNYFQKTEFKAKDVHAVQEVVSRFGDFELARDPASFFKSLLGMDISNLEAPAQQVLKPLMDMGRLWFKSGAKDWTSFIQMPGLLDNVNALSAVSGLDYEEILSKTLPETIDSFKQQLDKVREDMQPQLVTEMQNTTEALNQLRVSIDDLTRIMQDLSTTPSVADKITPQMIGTASTAKEAWPVNYAGADNLANLKASLSEFDATYEEMQGFSDAGPMIRLPKVTQRAGVPPLPSGGYQNYRQWREKVAALIEGVSAGDQFADLLTGNQQGILKSARMNMQAAGLQTEKALQDVTDTCVAFVVQGLRDAFNYDVGNIFGGSVLDTRLEELGWQKLTGGYSKGDILRSIAPDTSLHTSVFLGYDAQGNIQSIENQGVRTRAKDYWEYGWRMPPFTYTPGMATEASLREAAVRPTLPDWGESLARTTPSLSGIPTDAVQEAIETPVDENTTATEENTQQLSSLNSMMDSFISTIADTWNALGAQIANITGTDFTPIQVQTPGQTMLQRARNFIGGLFGGGGVTPIATGGSGQYRKWVYTPGVQERGHWEKGECTDSG